MRSKRIRTALKRITLAALIAAALFGTAASPATAASAAAQKSDEVSQNSKAIRVAERWYYLGRYYDLRACLNAADFATKPYGQYDDAECREVVGADYWELWGVIY